MGVNLYTIRTPLPADAARASPIAGWVGFDRNAAGYPAITHGGLVVAAGEEAIRRTLNLVSHDHPWRLTAHFAKPIPPGTEYPFTVRENDTTGHVLGFYATDQSREPLAVVMMERLAASAAGCREDLLALDAAETGAFHCIDSCAAFGRENPDGLHLQVHYQRKGRNFPAIWTDLDPPVGNGSAAQLMAIDELGFWIGALAHRTPGVTVKITTEHTRPALPEEPLRVVAEPAKVSGGGEILQVPVTVISRAADCRGELLCRAVVVCYADKKVVARAMGEESAALQAILQSIIGG